jgi:hypothetical protein
MNTAEIKRNILKGIAVAAIVGTLAAPALSVKAYAPAAPSGTEVVTLASTTTVGDSALVLMRLTLEPGASIRVHSHPSAAVITVESGTLQTKLVGGSAVITRGSTGRSERAEIGTKTFLQPGDSIAYDQGAEKTMENGADEALKLVASMLLAPDQPVFDYKFWPVNFNPHLQ